jgi:hypothetical protein
VDAHTFIKQAEKKLNERLPAKKPDGDCADGGIHGK